MIDQNHADKLFRQLSRTLENAQVELQPSDLFQAISDALVAQAVSLGAAISANATAVLTEMTEEKPWDWICLEVYRRTFYDVENLRQYAYGLILLESEGGLDDFTNYLIAFLTNQEIEPIAPRDALH